MRCCVQTDRIFSVSHAGRFVCLAFIFVMWYQTDDVCELGEKCHYRAINTEEQLSLYLNAPPNPGITSNVQKRTPNPASQAANGYHKVSSFPGLSYTHNSSRSIRVPVPIEPLICLPYSTQFPRWSLGRTHLTHSRADPSGSSLHSVQTGCIHLDFISTRCRPSIVIGSRKGP